MTSEQVAAAGAPLLGGFRVLELPGDGGELCGQVLAMMGAEVIRVEPPGGDPARWRPPFLSDRPDPDGSLPWLAFNRGKRSIVLDLEAPEGRDGLLSLAAGAGAIIESFAPGRMEALGIGYPDLRRSNPAIILTSITPFGQTGPYRAYQGPEVVVQALGGGVYVTGDPDRPPLPLPLPVGRYHAGVEGAAATMIAWYRRLGTGAGAHVDVSMQQCIVATIMATGLGWAPSSRELARAGASAGQNGGVALQSLWSCADGSVVFLIVTGRPGGAGAKSTRRLLEWMQAEGCCDAEVLGWDWEGLSVSSITPEQYWTVAGLVEAFFRGKTCAELAARAAQDRMLLAPLATVADLVNSPQLQARGFFDAVAHPELGRSIRYPGRPARLSVTPLVSGGRAPRLGEHQGLEAGAPGQTARPRYRGGAPPAPPLAGVKVADFSWNGAGPMAGKYLAHHGATVVRVESATRPDALRMQPPFRDGRPGINRSGFFAFFNTGKLGLALNLAKPEGRSVALRLAGWADVVIENFAPGQMERWGLGYHAIAAVNPGALMLSTTLQGSDGPWRDYVGLGVQGSALAGLHGLIGWPDRPPCGPHGAYTDIIAPRYAVAFLVAALAHRDRTGAGQHIELAQIETAAQFLAPELLDYTANGRVAHRTARPPGQAAPQGIYPCAGDDRWIAIAVEDGAQWAALATALGSPAWAGDPRFATGAGRSQHTAELDGLVGAATAGHDAWDLMERLQAAAVPAGVVLRPSDLQTDPQLQHRRLFRSYQHAELGAVPLSGLGFELAGEPLRPVAAHPCLGEHTDLVLRDLLGYTEDEVAALAAAGALE